jgi:hypothetical protein
MKPIDDDRMPILHLEADELLSRYESLLKTCYVQGIRLRVPTPISDIFHKTRIEVERRGLTPQVKRPSILNPNDPDPIFHNSHSIVRYLDEPFRSQFFSGLISLRSASEYVIDPNPARRDDEHERPFMYPNQTVKSQGIDYPASKIRLQRTIIGADGLPLPYYVVSFSLEESAKLTRAFNVNGYVIISDYTKLFRLLEKELVHHYPGASIFFRSVTYYDPLAGDPDPKTPWDTLSHKPIGYYYQHEVRIIVTSPDVLNDRLNLRISAPKGLLQIRKVE